jgi:hypothetical protein
MNKTKKRRSKIKRMQTERTKGPKRIRKDARKDARKAKKTIMKLMKSTRNASTKFGTFLKNL